MLRAEGRKQVQGKDRYVICDLAKPSEQPEACKLADVQAISDQVALARKRLDNGVSVASLSLPASFTADMRAGKNLALTVDAKGGFSVSQTVQQFAQAVSARLGGAVLAARVVTEHAKGDATFYNNVYNAAESVWAKDPVQIEEQYSTVTGTEVGTGYGQSSPGIGAMFVLINALTLGEVFIQERKQGTLQRLMVLPLSRAQILAGKLLGQYLVCVLAFALMIVVGTVLGVRWGDWLGVAVIVVVFTLAATAMGLAVAAVARTAGQASGARFLLGMILAPLGGAWWTLSIVPAWMRTVGMISPIYWSQDAFTKMIFYGAPAGCPAVGAGLASVLGGFLRVRHRPLPLRVTSPPPPLQLERGVFATRFPSAADGQGARE
jgi:ABC-2 type transport system permease protein